MTLQREIFDRKITEYLKTQDSPKTTGIPKSDKIRSCRLITCFFVTKNGSQRLKRHYKIFHGLKEKEYNLRKHDIKTLFWSKGRKGTLFYLTPNHLTTLSLGFVSPRSDLIKIPKIYRGPKKNY